MSATVAEQQRQRIVLVTGPSGAGRSTATNALEDFGFEAIDNMPLSLIPRLLEGSALGNGPITLGLDVRNREFSAEGLLELRTELGRREDITADLLYLDCAPAVLARRYSETRRRHPLAPDETPEDGIAREIEILGDIRTRADILIDTSSLNVHELRAELENWFRPQTGQRMAVSLYSFSYKRGLPQGLDMAFDCRFLRNPHWEQGLRQKTGRDGEVAAYVREDPRYAPFLDHLSSLIGFVLPAVLEEGKAHFEIGFGCTGGQHRSVAVTEAVAQALADRGWQVSIRHRELDRRGVAGAQARIVPAGKVGT